MYSVLEDATGLPLLSVAGVNFHFKTVSKTAASTPSLPVVFSNCTEDTDPSVLIVKLTPTLLTSPE